MVDNETTTKKRGRGRQPKKKPVLPKFNNEREIREYILTTSLELTLECKEIATKKNNIKKPSVANSKNQQYKTAIQSLKVANDILNNLQINNIEEKLQLMEEGLIASNVNNNGVEEPSSETIETIEKLAELTEQLAELKQ